MGKLGRFVPSYYWQVPTLALIELRQPLDLKMFRQVITEEYKKRHGFRIGSMSMKSKFICMKSRPIVITIY